MGDVAPKKIKNLECKIYRSTLVCTALCHAHIVYVHSTYPRMSKACIHIGIHEHPKSNGTCHESIDMTYQYVANEVMKTSIAKNTVIIMGVSK